MKISIIIPCYNEEKTLKIIVEKVLKFNEISKEIIIVDDCSTDNSKKIIEELKIKYNEIKSIFSEKNTGKGGALKKGFEIAEGDIVLIQDADLEYDPKDYHKLILPILNNESKVVYGSRVLNQKRYFSTKFTSKIRVFGNHVLTLISNFFNNQKLTDAHTCYKVFHKEVFDKIKLEENDFAFCPEVTTKISNLKYDITEVPISYNGRNYQEGKKIRFIDAIKALKTLIKYRLKRS